MYKQLSAIAPTLFYQPYPIDEEVSQLEAMRRDFMTVAEALGREAEGREARVLDAKLTGGAEGFGLKVKTAILHPGPGL